MAATTATASLLRAATMADTPPGRDSSSRASPPPAGKAHSPGFGSSASLAASGSGRAELNSNSPLGANTGEASPDALRVSRRASFLPLGSTSQSAVCHFFFSGSSIATAVTSRDPSWDSASPPSRGMAL
ncbi:MAG: hypothetical protein WKF47_04595 [Geodermatophilaceae bacterium]